MSSAVPDPLSAPPPIDEPGSLVGMIRDAQLGWDDAVVEMQELAARAQRYRRFETKVSDVGGITRSTALWAAMQVDGGIRTTLEECGISADSLAKELSLNAVKFPDPPVTYELHTDFASAMGTYLADRDVDGRVGLAEVVLAMLRSAQSSTSGLLALRVPLDARSRAVERLEAMLGPRRRPRVDLREFSESVRAMHQAFPEGEPVTAGRLAARLQSSHREYAHGDFGRASLDTELGMVLPVDEWLRRVRDLYDMPAVLSSKEQVLTGRLFLLGLAALDPSFAHDLTKQGLLEALQSEVDVLPRVDSAPASAADEALAGGVDTDRVDPTEGISLSKDRLGVATYVRMLGTLIRDRATPVPLSIGIFGEWGSGKSYFMGMLRQHIDDLKDEPEDQYWKDVRQISFNAWHYADSNLWASLGDEIFRQLLGEKDDNEARQTTLRAELEKANQQRQELEAAATHAEGEAARLRARVEAAATNRDVRATNLLLAMKKSPTLNKQLGKVWRRLGVHDPVEQSRILAEQVAGTANDASVIRRSLADRRGLLVAGAAVIVLLAVGAIAIWSASLETLVRAGAATVAGFLATAVALTRATRSGLKRLGTVISEVQADVAKQQDEQMGPLLQSLREAEAASDLAASQLANVVDRIGQLGQELAELAPGRRLYTFLAERVATGDYSRNLGLISTIRKDFEQLIDLMRDWQERRNRNEEAPVPIDRIVLYIDDLDRCSPKQVVEVLQAVHLLLALELFIVVVGVDPRWLLRSLQREYPDLLEPSVRGKVDTDGWDADPVDYLEKIFTIPLILPAMADGSLEKMLQEVVAKQEERNRRDSEDSATDGSDGAPNGSPTDRSPEAEERATPDDAELPIQPDPTAITLEAGSQASGTASRTLRPLSEDEIKLLAALQRLVRTPREAKRMVNLYRMIRSTRDLSPTSRFMGEDGKPGDYQAVALLLGLLSAPGDLLGDVLDAPPEKADILGGLTHRNKTGTWSEFVAGMTPEEKDEKWANQFATDLSLDDRVRWQRLAAGLAPATPLVGLTDLSELQTWAEKIRRFSFIMSPSVGRATQDPARSESGSGEHPVK